MAVTNTLAYDDTETITAVKTFTLQGPVLKNYRLGWRGLPGTDTLAYYENPQIAAAISFIVQAPSPRIH
jgi:hypothetical protein